MDGPGAKPFRRRSPTTAKGSYHAVEMNKPEFNQWLHDYQVRFPDTATWISKQDSRQEMLAIWLDALAGVDLLDALEVNRQLTTGETERWKNSGGYHEREETPAMIRKLAWAIRSRRVEPPQEPQRESVTPVAFPISILFRQLVAVNERWAENPDFDKQAEHARLKAAFLDKYGIKPVPDETLAAYQRDFAP